MWNMLVKIPERFVHLDASYVYQSMDLTNDKPSNCEMHTILKDFKWELFPTLRTPRTLLPVTIICFRHWNKRFSLEAELDTEISLFFLNMDPSFYHLGIEKLVLRYNKCLDLLGEYVEK